MKFIFAPDSFKGSLSAMECCDILERVTARIFPGTETVSVPVADGGEGTVDALLRAMGGERIHTRVTGPMFEEETAVWGRTSDGSAVMEMAQASGLPYVPADQRDPRRATSLGTGEMIAEALRSGVRSILIGIGGSATNDGGMGMLKALGAKFTDENGEEVEPVGAGLARVMHADFSGLMPELKETQITVICDVTNPLLGENGATFIYGPQKGAVPAIRDELEAGMAHYAEVVSRALGREIASFPGAGAAGGLGAALSVFLHGNMKSGIEAVLDLIRFDERLEGVDLIVTGEGRTDWQSCFGKVMQGIGTRAKAHGIPALGLSGSLGKDAMDICNHGISSLMTTVNAPMSLEEALQNAETLYYEGAVLMFRFVKAGMDVAAK